MGPTKQQMDKIYQTAAQMIILSLPRGIKLSSVELAALMGVSRMIGRDIANKLEPNHPSVKKIKSGHRSREVTFHATESPDTLKLHSYLTSVKIWGAFKYSALLPKDIIEEVDLAVSNIKELRAQNRNHTEFWLDYWRTGYRPCIFVDQQGNKTPFPFQSKVKSKRARVQKTGFKLAKPYALIQRPLPSEVALPSKKEGDSISNVVEKLEHRAKVGAVTKEILVGFLDQFEMLIKQTRQRLAKEVIGEGKAK